MTAGATAASEPVLSPSHRRRRLLAEHGPILAAVVLAVVIRAVVQAAFWPAFIHGDSPAYLMLIDQLEPFPDRPVGYVLLLLYPLARVADHVALVAIVQHVLGLATAVVLYALVRRWGVGRWLAVVATLPVLFDYLQLNLEHSVLSDVLFELMVVGGIAVLSWRRRLSVPSALVGGLILGASVIVRLVGEPLILAGIVFCLLIGTGWRDRLLTTVAVTIGFLIPLGAYSSWYHHEHGIYALSQFSGKSLYLRSTSFVDCSKISVPDYQRVLCPPEPVGERRDPTDYVFHDTDTIPELHPPPGTTADQALRQFAFAAIRAQPLDYAHIVVRDFFLNFKPTRVDDYEYDTAHKWGFDDYVDLEPTSWTGPAFEAHGGEQQQTTQPFADALVRYQKYGYLPGPLLLVCLLLGLVGAVGVGRARTSGLRSVTFLLLATGTGLILVPDVTAEFVWRYQLPAIALLPAAAVLAFSGLRGLPARDAAGPSTAGELDDPDNDQVDAPRVATASTD